MKKLKEYAKEKNVSYTTVYRWHKAGLIKCEQLKENGTLYVIEESKDIEINNVEKMLKKMDEKLDLILAKEK